MDKIAFSGKPENCFLNKILAFSILFKFKIVWKSSPLFNVCVCVCEREREREREEVSFPIKIAE
jgi:hypothetical protein